MSSTTIIHAITIPCLFPIVTISKSFFARNVWVTVFLTFETCLIFCYNQPINLLTIYIITARNTLQHIRSCSIGFQSEFITVSNHQKLSKEKYIHGRSYLFLFVLECFSIKTFPVSVLTTTNFLGHLFYSSSILPLIKKILISSYYVCSNSNTVIHKQIWGR